MAKSRLINCEFINASSFKVNTSNKAKLLYLYMFTHADDRGFVDTTNDIINALKNNDNEFDKTENMSLLENTYETALNELIEKGLIYEFTDNHKNKIHLIRHWFFHNHFIKGLWTNYRNLLDKVHIENNEYLLGSKKPLKEDIKENNINQDILNNDIEDKEDDELTEEDIPFPVDPSFFKKGKKK